MIKRLSLSTYLRYILAILTAMTLCIAGAGLSPANATTPEKEAVTTVVEDTTVISETDAGAVGLKLPGALTNQAQVSLTGVPEEYLEATEKTPLASTKLPHSAISSYETVTGTQTLIRIDSDQASHEYRFPLELPEGATTELIEDGGIFIKDANGETLGGYKEPWAIDAAGAQIPTQFRIEDDTLIQTVKFTEQTAFPVIADPNGFWGWTQCAAAIGGLVAVNAIAAFRIAKIGGIVKAVNILKTARTKSQTWQVLKQIFGEITGIGSVLRSCF